MRLIGGHKGSALRGMQDIADIPECWGMHGVGESGQPQRVVELLQSTAHQYGYGSTKGDRQPDKDKVSPSIFEGGGVKVIRPLLWYSKQALIDVCRDKDVQWVEDLTNKEAWRTPRNAVRIIFSRSKLPPVLSKTSILDLASRMQEKEKSIIDQAEQLASESHLVDFDLRSGSLTVRFVDNITGNLPPSAQVNTGNERRVASSLLKKFVGLVSPLEEVSLQSLQSAINNVFFMDGPAQYFEEKDPGEDTFTAAGTLFQRHRGPLWWSTSEEFNREKMLSALLDKHYIWTLSRQPFATNHNTPDPRSAPKPLLISDRPQTPGQTSQPLEWSPWHLWDGRYWIQILNHTTNPLQIRPLHPSDMSIIRTALPPEKSQHILKTLSSAAPGKIRWTLPIITEVNEEDAVPGRILAFPTFGEMGDVDVVGKDGRKKAEWKVRYKKVDLGFWRDASGGGRRKGVIHSWEDS